jgi:hypothetical protein
MTTLNNGGLKTGQLSNISTTTPVALTDDVYMMVRSTSVKASKDNTGIIYVGGSDDVSASTGVPLSAGEPLNNIRSQPNQIYVIASASNQNLSWSAD